MFPEYSASAIPIRSKSYDSFITQLTGITASTEYGGQEILIDIDVPRSAALGTGQDVPCSQDLAAKSKNTLIAIT